MEGGREGGRERGREKAAQCNCRVEVRASQPA